MKHLKNTFLLLVTICLLFSCDKEETFKQNNTLQEKVSNLVSKKQSLPKNEDFNNINWKCSDWLIRFYNNEEKIGEWNSYEKTITNNEKNQTYHFKNNQLNITDNQQTKNSNKVHKYKWDNSGNLSIDNIQFVCRLENNKFYMYFDTNDNEKIGKIFNISVDNTFSKAINSSGLQGLGMIGFTKKPSSIASKIEMTSHDLAQKFHNRDKINNQVFNTIKTTNDAYQFVLTNGQDQNEHLIQIKNQQIDLANITPERAKLLYEKFMTKNPFSFKGVNVVINKIDHEDGSGNSFLVYGNAGNKNVKFYYNTASNKEHWLIAPTNSNSDITSYDLVQKFHDRDKINNQVFNTIKTTNDAYQFVLTNGQGQNEHLIQIKNQQIDLANITPERAKLLFEKFMTKNPFSFKGVNVVINKIDHEDSSGNSFLVYGTAGNQNIKFYYNTASNKEHWLIAPANSNSDITSYDLVQKFHDRDKINNQVFNTIKTTNDAYQFVLTNGQGQNEHLIQIKNQQIDLANITPERAKLLFEKFMTKNPFSFKGVSVLVNKIDHEDGSGNSFLVYGTAGHKNVKFYYNTASGKEHWLIAPTN
jgi:hypothetical protein